MLSSQSAAKFKHNSRTANRLELIDPTSSSQGSLMLQRQESSSMSLGSQEQVLSRDSQQSPVRKLYQMYTSKESLFTKNKKNNEANRSFQEPITKDENSSISVLNFLIKDLSEKCLVLNENIEKTIQTSLNNFLFEIENQLVQKNLDELDQSSTNENSRIKIAELETIIHEKNETIQSLKTEIAKLRQERENVSYQRFYEFLTSTLDTTLKRNFKLADDENVSRSKELLLRMETMLNENLQQMKNSQQPPKVLAPVPLKKFETAIKAVSRSGNVRPSTGRKPKTPSLKKTPLDFVFKELNPKESRRSAPFFQRLSYNVDRCAVDLDSPNVKTTTPLSDIGNMFVVPSSDASFGGYENRNPPLSRGKRSWRRMSTTSFDTCQFTVAETSSEDLSISSSEIDAQKSTDFDDEDKVVIDDMGNMSIKKNLGVNTNRMRTTNAFATKVKHQNSENNIFWA